MLTTLLSAPVRVFTQRPDDRTKQSIAQSLNNTNTLITSYFLTSITPVETPKINRCKQNKLKYLTLVTVDVLERQVHLGCNDTKEETENVMKCKGRYVRALSSLQFIAEICWMCDMTIC